VLTEDYRVQLDAFEGPLDLLLYLIRKNEVDVHDIPVSTIAEQYMGFLTHIDRIDIDVAGEFLVMAATLMEVKSRMLTPTPKAVEGDTDGPTAPVADPRAELVRQLLAYKKYRDAATALEHRANEWRSRFGVGRAGIENSAIQAAIESAPEMDIHDLELIDLFEAFQRIAESVNFERLGEHQVQYDDTPIELHAEDIVDRLKRDAVAVESGKAELPFIGLFNGRTRSEMVGLFLAMLELCRRLPAKTLSAVADALGSEVLAEVGVEMLVGDGADVLLHHEVLVVARFFIVAVLVVYHLVHAVVVTELHYAFVDCTNLWSYLCTPVVTVAVAEVNFCFGIHALQLLDEL
jgi:segregation and condensation protein A